MLLPDGTLGPYRLITRIGRGGMGEVWKAEDTRLGRLVAIKVLPVEVAADAEATARLKREARTAAQLYHPNIATIHSIEQEDGVLFIVMEFVEGDPLTGVISRGGISEAELCRMARGVADALAEAHGKGIVHRDIKPDNIIVRGPRVKVLDFGIAKQVGVVTTSPEAATTYVTQQGMILGTVHYMSPEQALGKTLDGRTDIFSLGVVLYEAATGRLPFRGETMTDTMTRIIRDDPPEPLRVNPGISSGLNAIIQRCMRKSPDQRYANAVELVAALDEQLGVAQTVPFTSRTTATRLLPAPPAFVTQQWPAGRIARIFGVTALIVMAATVVGFLALRRHPAAGGRAEARHTVSGKQEPARHIEVRPQPIATVTVTAPATTAPAPVAVPEPARHTKVRPPQTQLQPEAQPTAPEPPPADAAYSAGLADLVAGNVAAAREKFHDAVKADRHHAKAHFRLGEIALFTRNLLHAEQQTRAALADAGRLTERERSLARLILALATRNRFEAEQIAGDIGARWPNDPDLARIERAFNVGVRRRSRRF